jgi:hypothetical protein
MQDVIWAPHRPLVREVAPFTERILSGELWPGQSALVGCEGDPADTEQAELIFRGAGKRTLVPDTVPADRASRNHSRSDGR